MTTFEIISLGLNILFVSGGLITVVTLKSAIKKSQSEADMTEAQAEGSKMTNDEKASQILMQYIVEPLKKEINALRRDIRALQRAIGKISECPHADDCPVRHELQKHQDDCEGSD